MSAENRLTSIVSYPERGTGGNNRYRGNCSPKLIEDLIGFFKPAEICDYMCGSGTTQDAAHTMGIISHCYDLHSGFDLINCEIPERPEFVFWHPPYWDMITYSDVMYKASEVQSKYGYDPRQFDLSRIPKWEDFVRVMNYAMMKQFCALERGGRMAVLVGDIKKKGQLYSMLFELIKPGTLENVIIKAQHNCFSNQTQYSGHFIPILHEYLQLLGIHLSYPVNAMTRICKKLSLPKKAALEAIGMFEMAYGGGTATAHDVFMAMQEIPYILKSDHAPESKMLVVEENMARALTLRWGDYDLAKAVSYCKPYPLKKLTLQSRIRRYYLLVLRRIALILRNSVWLRHSGNFY